MLFKLNKSKQNLKLFKPLKFINNKNKFNSKGLKIKSKFPKLKLTNLLKNNLFNKNKIHFMSKTSKIFFNKKEINNKNIDPVKKYNDEYNRKVDDLTNKSKNLINYLKLNYPNYNKLQYPTFRKLPHLIQEKNLEAKLIMFKGLKNDLNELEKKNPGRLKKFPSSFKIKVKNIKSNGILIFK